MNLIDLHVHTTASDGSSTPEEVVDRAVEKELSAIAITDHDCVFGIEPALKKAEEYKNKGTAIRVIPGVEISAAYHGFDIHMIGLFIDHEHPHFLESLRLAREEREKRNEAMAAKLRAAGMDITMEELMAEADDAVITRAHFGKLLVKKGYVPDIKEAFAKYLHDKSPYYVPREYISPQEAISLIREAGGISILAHPTLYKLNDGDLRRLISSLKEAGLQGMEAIYSSYSQKEEAHIRSLCRKYDLLLSGGSDYHGAAKPDIALGSGRGRLRIPEALLIPMEQALASGRN